MVVWKLAHLNIYDILKVIENDNKTIEEVIGDYDLIPLQINDVEPEIVDTLITVEEVVEEDDFISDYESKD